MRAPTQGVASAYVSLFASSATLVCCALPALLVLLGLGAATASLLSAAPWLATLSRHKDWVFAGAGALLLANAWLVHRPVSGRAGGGAACPPEDHACERAGRTGRILLCVSASVYGVGFFVAYLLAPVLVWWSE